MYKELIKNINKFKTIIQIDMNNMKIITYIHLFIRIPIKHTTLKDHNLNHQFTIVIVHLIN